MALEFDICCTECGKSLDSGFDGRKMRLDVELCPDCLDKKDDEIIAAKEELEIAVEEIKALKDQIEALEIELAYNKIKNQEPYE
jgi:hypothetical protein